VHETPLVTTIAAALGVALALGFVTQRLRLSPIVGYLLAGIAIGPHTPSFVADQEIALELSEIGVALLMFGVGLHFHLKDLLSVKTIAIPGAVAQSALATGLGLALAMSLGWGLASGLVLGIGLGVASTVVLVRGLEDSDQLATPAGHIAVGWLIVEDIFTVVVLVMLPALTVAITGAGAAAGAWPVLHSLGVALGKVALLAVLMLVAGRRIVPWLLTQVARTRSRELFTLTVLALAIGIAVVSARAFGASMALGAFLAGMVVGQSTVSHQAAADALPMRDAFAVLFFVSVGMLFDPSFLLDQPWLVAGTLAIILLAKPLAAVLIVLAMGRSVHTALIVAVGLAQIGEFSFILATAAVALNPAGGAALFDPRIVSALVAAALLSITLNPLLFRCIAPLEAWLRRRPRLWALLTRRSEAQGLSANDLTQGLAHAAGGATRAVVVGYGPVGQTVARILRELELEPVVIDLNVDTILRLSGEGRPAIYGDAARAEVLRAAGIETAKYLVVTLPALASRIPVVITARDLNPNLRVLVRARYMREAPMLEEIGSDLVSFEEVEAAVALAGTMLREVGADQRRIDAEAAAIRRELAGGRLQS
jgi:CPA2 family monovalent cation:H+ antiporter-2